MGTSGPTPSTLPRGGSLMRAFSPAGPPIPADRVKNHPGSGTQSSTLFSYIPLVFTLRRVAIIPLHFIIKAFQFLLNILEGHTMSRVYYTMYWYLCNVS